MRQIFPVFAAGLAALLAPLAALAEPIAVRHPEGTLHGFLALSTIDGAALADGELTQTASGSRVTSRLAFRFHDGSFQEETTVFTEDKEFRLVTDHLVQRGPAFPRPMDVTIDAASGRVSVRTVEDGREKTYDETLELPPDLANGLVLVLAKNLRKGAARTAVPMVATTPKPRLVTLVLAPSGTVPFTLGRSTRRANRYVVKVELGGVAGVVAPIVGKQPPDAYIFILPGDAPAFVRSESPFFAGASNWRIDLTSPVWPRAGAPPLP